MLAFDPTEWIVRHRNLLIPIAIAIPFVIAFAFILLITVLTLKNWIKWKIEFERAARQDWKETHRPDGKPYPPAARGICQQCEKYSPCVLSTHDGHRICKSCYDNDHADEYTQNVNCKSGENHE